MLLNRERALGLMERFDLDALVATTPENVTYLSDFVGWSQRTYPYVNQVYAVFFRHPDRAAAMVIPRQEITYVCAQRPWIEDIHFYGRIGGTVIPREEKPVGPEETWFLRITGQRGFGSPGEALTWVLKDRGVSRGKIALDEDRVSAATRERLGQDINAPILPGANLFRLIRMVKTPEELERLRAAAAVNEEAYRAIFRAVREGISEQEVAAVWRRVIAEAGGIWLWLHFAAGRRSSSISPPTDRRLKRGDLFSFDGGLVLNNYNADTGGCGILGEPTERHHAMHQAIKAGLEAGLATIRAGVKASEIFKATMERVRRRGFPDHQHIFAGHTIGLEAREFPFVIAPAERVSDPFLPETSDIPLETNTVLNLEVPAGVFGWGGMQIEQTVVVKPNGFEYLIPQERRLEVIP